MKLKKSSFDWSACMLSAGHHDFKFYWQSIVKLVHYVFIDGFFRSVWNGCHEST